MGSRRLGTRALGQGGRESRQRWRSKPTTTLPSNRSQPQVARAYFSAIEAAQQEAERARDAQACIEEYLKLTDVRKQQGFASDFELAQVKSRTAAAKDTLHAAESARAQAIRAIEVVTSHYPAGKLGVRRSFPSAAATRAGRVACRIA